MSRAPLHLPPPGRLRATGPVDYVERYFGGFGAATVLRRRLQWVRDALPSGGCDRLLEIGYGSGVFAYELAQHAREIYGLDIHTHGAEVRSRCAIDGVSFTPVQGNGQDLPFATFMFDVVVILSALEFMNDPAACLRESFRVLKPGGRIIAVTPRVHPWADALWKAFTGNDPEAEFQGGRQRVKRAMEHTAIVADRVSRPRGLPRALAPYEVVIIRRNSHSPRRPTPPQLVALDTYRTM